MSGIAAIFRTDGGQASPGLVDAMTQAMSYRAPDGSHRWNEGEAAIGHCAMHTSLQSRANRQPLSSEDGALVAAMDGYFANFGELRRNLLERGCQLRDRSEAELLLHAYAQWGEECLDRLDGEFAFVLWDKRRKRGLCGRDHMGLRPLHYFWDGTTLVVASDVAAILAALPVPPAVNRAYLAETMAAEWISPDETVWQGIMHLKPAHYLICENGAIRQQRYWKVPADVDIRYRSDGEYAEHYSAVLENCVAEACRTDSPLGCEVSGGLDSTAVFALALEQYRAGAIPAPSLHGYSFDAPPGTDADESAYVRDIEAMFEVQIAKISLFAPDMSWLAQQTRTNRSLAPYPNTAMFTHLGERLVADGCRVSLNGQGGDHWLNGTHFYYAEALEALAPLDFARSLRSDARAFGMRRAAALALQYGLAPQLPGLAAWARRALRRNRQQSPTRDREDLYWLAPDLREQLTSRREAQRLEFADYRRSFKRVKAELPMVVRLLTMLNLQSAQIGYESRSPMFSRKFVEFSASTPESIRFAGGMRKIVHRQAMAGRIPESVRNRTTKAEFSQVSQHLSGEIEEIFLSGRNIHQLELFDRAGIEQLARKYCSAAIDAEVNWEVMGCCLVYLFASDIAANTQEGI